MSISTLIPTANQTPDPGQGGLAVTGNINTGHGSTIATGPISGVGQTKTCIWTGFAAVTGQIASIRLLLDWSENGTVGLDASNSFRIEYSVNGGGAWTSIFVHSNITSSNSSSSNVVLPTADPTQVQVRDSLSAEGSDSGAASVTASVSNIRLEVTTVDGQVIVLM